MTERRDIPALLEAHLDGRLDPEATRSFESLLAESPELRAQLELQEKIDGAIARTFAAPEGAAHAALIERCLTVTPVPPTTTVPDRSRNRIPAWTFAAAAAVILTLTLWFLRPVLFSPEPPRDPYAGLAKQTLPETYDTEIARGFVPTVICRDADEFSGWFEDQFGVPLAFDAAPGIEALGLGYSRSVSRRTIHLLAHVDGEPVVVFIDRNPAIGGDAAARDGLFIHEQRLGPLYLYEASASPEARVMRRLRIP